MGCVPGTPRRAFHAVAADLRGIVHRKVIGGIVGILQDDTAVRQGLGNLAHDALVAAGGLAFDPACIQGDGRDILEQAQGAVFASSESVESLEEAILKLCSLSDDERKSLGQNNLKYYEEHLSFQILLDKITDELISAKTR